MTDSPHFSENDDVEINLDVLTPDETEKKDDQVDIDLGDLGEEDSAKEPEINLDFGDDKSEEASDDDIARNLGIGQAADGEEKSDEDEPMPETRTPSTPPLRSCATSCPRSSVSGTCSTLTPAWRTR